MRNPRNSLQVAILTTVLAAGTAACGASASSAGGGATATAKPAASASATASADPLAGLTGQQIIERAVSDTEAAASVHLTGSISNSGQTIGLDLTLTRGKGCAGTLTEGKNGSFRLIFNGTTVWILPDQAFYQSSGVPAAALAILQGKYLAVKANGSGLSSLAEMCSLSTMLKGFSSPPANTPAGSATTIDGHRALKFSDTTDSAYLYVSDTMQPDMLQTGAPGSAGGQLDFSYPATPLAITAPPASEVIDGSTYGF